MREEHNFQSGKVPPNSMFANAGGLLTEEVNLFGQQLKLPEIGREGQIALRNATVVLIGAGGLGSPAALYLACAGIGTLKIIDGDSVALSNLHRQIIHDIGAVGTLKVESAAEQCRKRNPLMKIIAVNEFVSLANLKSLIADATVVIDATDNARTRYEINEACVFLKKPLVSGSALRWEGQLSVYNFLGGPCYRCVFPDIPEINTTGACDMAGIVGPVVGTIGVLQALEAVKVILALQEIARDPAEPEEVSVSTERNLSSKGPASQGDMKRSVLSRRLLIFDALCPNRLFRIITLKDKRPNCPTCSGRLGSQDKPDAGLVSTWVCPDMHYPTVPEMARISPAAFFEKALMLETKEGNLRRLHVLPGQIVLDVRHPHHIAVFELFGSIPWHVDDLLAVLSNKEETISQLKGRLQKSFGETKCPELGDTPIYVLCRRGKDAARVTNAGIDLNFVLVIGGLQALKNEVAVLRDLPFL